MTQESAAPAPPPVWQRALGVLGLVAHVVVGFFYLAAGLVTPMPWLIGFWVAWLVFLAVAIWLLIRHPLWTLLVPVVAFGFIFGGVSLGEAVLGWTG